MKKNNKTNLPAGSLRPAGGESDRQRSASRLRSAMHWVSARTGQGLQSTHVLRGLRPLLPFVLLLAGVLGCMLVCPGANAAGETPPPMDVREEETDDVRAVMQQARQALADRLANRDLPGAAEARLSLASALSRLGQDSDARRLLESVLETAVSVHRDDLFVRAQLQLAALQADQPSESLDILDRALPVASRTEPRRLVAQLQRDRAKHLVTLGKSVDALAALGEALAIARDERQPRLEVDVRRELARAYSALGQWGDALEQIEIALPIAESLQSQRLKAALSARHSSIDLNLGRRRTAVGLARAAVSAAAAAQDAELTAECRVPLALALLSIGDLTSAEKEAAAARYYYIQVGDRDAEIGLLVELAFAYRDLDLVPQAVATTTELTRLLAAKPRHDDLYVEYLALRFWAGAMLGDGGGALAELETAIQTADGLGNTNMAARLRGQLAAHLRVMGQPAGRAVPLLDRAIQDLQGSRWLEDAWWLWFGLGDAQDEAGDVAAAARAYTQVLQELRAAPDRSANQRLRRLFPPDLPGALRRILVFRVQHGDAAGAFEVAELARSSRARALTEATGGRLAPTAPIDRDLADRLRRSLKPGDLFVEYVLADPLSYLFLVDHSGVRAERLSPARTMSDSIGQCRKGLTSGTPLVRLRTELGQVSDYLLTMIFPHSGNRPARIIIVTDDVLDRFPFEILPIEEGDDSSFFDPDGDLMMETTVVSYAPSAAAWLAIKPEIPRDQPVTKAAAVFGAQSSESLLRESKRGIERVVAHIVGRESAPVPSRSRRFADAYLSLPTPASLLCFVTETKLDLQNPDATGIVFDDGKGGIELVGLRRLSEHRKEVNLGVIAAIRESGEKDPGPIEAAIVNTLLASGFKSVLMPGWPVSDGETARYLEVLGRELANGYSPEDAVRRAKLRALRGDDSPSPSWAAFRLMGRGEQPICRPSHVAWWVLLGAIGLLVGTGVALTLSRRRQSTR